MDELQYLINKYGSMLTAKDIAQIIGCDIRKVYELAKKQNMPVMAGYKEIRVNTTNYYLWTLANYNMVKYEKYKLLYLESLGRI